MTVTVYDRMEAAQEAIQRMRVPQPDHVMRPGGPNGLQAVYTLATRRTAPYLYFQQLAAQFGPVTYFRFNREHVYLLSDPGLIWQAFVTDGRSMLKGRGLQLTRTLLGNGLLNSEGDYHRRNRRLVQPAFHRQAIAGYAADMVGSMRDLSDRWDARILGRTDQVDVVEQMSSLTLDVVGRTLFGADLTGDAAEVGDALNQSLVAFSRLVSPLGPLLVRLPSRSRRTMLESVQRLDRVVTGLIDSKRSEIAAGHAATDVASLLMQTIDEETGESLTDDEVRDETMTLVLAGHETTAMTLSWALRDLTMHADTLAWIREEIDALPDRDLTLADIAALPRTHAVVAESMRLHPPAWMLPRYTAADVELGGWLIPAGCVVLASQYTMHRTERFWPEADRFLPRRWLADGRFDEKTPGVPRGVWFPVGFGSRRCIGEQFAWVEAVLVLATLLREWEVTVLAPEAPPACPIPPYSA